MAGTEGNSLSPQEIAGLLRYADNVAAKVKGTHLKSIFNKEQFEKIAEVVQTGQFDQPFELPGLKGPFKVTRQAKYYFVSPVRGLVPCGSYKHSHLDEVDSADIEVYI